MKKLPVKYQSFHSISKTCKVVKQRDGGDPGFIDLYTKDIILYKDIHAKLENGNCNYFVEVLHECVTSMNDITGQQLQSFAKCIRNLQGFTANLNLK